MRRCPTILRLQVDGAGTGDGVAGVPVIVHDLSDSGLVPQSNNNGFPGDTGTSNDPTPLTNCFDDMSGGLSCNDLVQVSLNQNCVANLTPDMVLEGEEEDCTDNDLLPLGTYYEVFL
ncbi:MAG: hypothetical protein R2788_00875 [Saprospiraceae bacterium]